MVLIFTNKEDSHPNFVIEHLADAGVPVFRLNTEALLTDYEFSWWADASGCDFVIRCKASGLSVRGSEITAVWDRRPEKPAELPVQNTAQINKHNLDEAFGFLYFIRYYLKDVPSIGSIANDRPASSKMLQLRYALEVGFKVPDTCFTNTKAAVTEHLADDRDYVLKPIESDNVWDEAADSQWVFFAARTSAQNLREAPDEAYSQTVTFLQEYVDKAFELRVTVVGDRAFACRIDSQAQATATASGGQYSAYRKTSHESVSLTSAAWDSISDASTSSSPPLVNTFSSSAIPTASGSGSNSRPACPSRRPLQNF